ncbi:MAG TPA: FtsX-like permease family protein [Puia sp.]|nr:FtsX-like permease family protein [Puia sp.]
MLKNYLTVAFRNIRRNKAFSVINILGLSIGISSALIIYLIAHYDFSFDRFEPGGDRIYRVVSKGSDHGNTHYTRGVPAPLGEAIRKGLPGIEELTIFEHYDNGKVVVSPGSTDQRSFKGQDMPIVADQNYFNLVPYEWLAGSPQTALTQPGRVVLNETKARLYFPKLAFTEMVGQKVIYDDTILTTVAGVVADLGRKGNTDFTYTDFISLLTILDNKYLRDQYNWDNWQSGTSDMEVFVRLGEGIRPAAVEAGLSGLYEKYNRAEDKKNGGGTGAWLLQPLSDVHFNANYGTLNADYNNIPLADKNVLYSLILIAAFLLLLGCINFINLTTAQATQRAKEIGVRKTMGSSKGQLISQFLSETFIITLAATVLSLAIMPFLLRTFTDFIPAGVHFSASQPYVLGFGVILVCAVSLLAGFYPAIVLSSWKPVQVLKGQLYQGERGAGKVRVRQILTVFQFFIAQAFVMATLLVGKQISFLLNQDLGFHKESTLWFRTHNSADTSYSQRRYFVRELQQIPGVVQAGLCNDVPSSGNSWTTGLDYQDGKNPVHVNVEVKQGDTNYLSIFHISLLAGRMTAPAEIFKEMVINETTLHALGFQRPADALGKIVGFNGKQIPIVGVMKDFYAHPLDKAEANIKPMVFTEVDRGCRRIIVALPGAASKATWKPTIAQIEAQYKKTYPGEEFDFHFFDESINAYYSAEQQTAMLLQWAMGVTVFISCMGLLGLVIYTTRQRIKEIGVRKVLGASVTNIVAILSKDFLKLVAIAFVLAIPLVWWAFHRWIDNFAVRTEMSWWVFAASGLGMILLAFITLSIQTIRAARSNPINSLRTE